MPVEKGSDLCAMPLNHLLTPRQGIAPIESEMLPAVFTGCKFLIETDHKTLTSNQYCETENDPQCVQRGKLDIQQVRDNGFHCQSVSFNSSFNSGTPVRVFASIDHGNESSTVHDTAFIWVEDMTTSRFKACLVQGGQGAGGNTTIDWFAFQGSQSGVYHGGLVLAFLLLEHNVIGWHFLRPFQRCQKST
ncbi:hypothetical protein OS493_035557 [Desmophyllum pertusum]|uniref:Uncharacterized protein n=1 Tax=Desmophyllum pertusum TaxID=174260 RepID=A0A9W9Y7Q2_9CNID|nr:hypothetical protein OS493_035557 [Desmophyllum pertusum]